MPSSPLFLFAHGAGAPSSSPWMRRWAERLATLGAVSAFDYPYMQQKRRAPDRLPALIAAHRQALVEAQQQHGADRPVVLAGKSMGSRVGCHLAVELVTEAASPALQPAALICFGYPLRAPGSGQLRDEVLRALKTPVLFLQGTKDPLCPLPDLDRVRGEMTAPSDLLAIDGGDHSLELRRRRVAPGERSQDDWDGLVLAKIHEFLRARGVAAGQA